MMRFSVSYDGVERYQNTKRCGYEAGDEDESAFHSKMFLGLVGITDRNLQPFPR
jgi:hypothetical protein